MLISKKKLLCNHKRRVISKVSNSVLRLKACATPREEKMNSVKTRFVKIFY